jgi:hypothetical protein
LTVAGEHDDSDAFRMQRLDRFGCTGFYRIGDSDESNQSALATDEHCGLAIGAQLSAVSDNQTNCQSRPWYHADGTERWQDAPNGRPLRSLAFLGTDLYLASSDSLSIIVGATNQTTCQGGCNGVTLNDGFADAPHAGLASNGIDTAYFSVAGSVNQVRKYALVAKTFTIVSWNGVDRTGASAGNFSFAGAKEICSISTQRATSGSADDTGNGTTACGPHLDQSRAGSCHGKRRYPFC